MKWIVQLGPGVWSRDCDGDPGRTLVEENATRYPTRKAATLVMLDAKRYRPYRNAEVQEVAADNSDD